MNLLSVKAVGWFGSFLLATCCIPEVISAVQNGHAKGLTWGFLLMWYFGEILILIPVIVKIKEKFLIFNYLFNIIGITIIIYYKLIGG